MNKNKIKESKQSDSAEHNLSDNNKNIRLPIYYGQKQNIIVHLFTLGDPSQNIRSRYSSPTERWETIVSYHSYMSTRSVFNPQ